MTLVYICFHYITVEKLQISGPSGVVQFSPIRVPDIGQKCLGRASIKQKMYSSGEKVGEKAPIRATLTQHFASFRHTSKIS